MSSGIGGHRREWGNVHGKSRCILFLFCFVSFRFVYSASDFGRSRIEIYDGLLFVLLGKMNIGIKPGFRVFAYLLG